MKILAKRSNGQMMSFDNEKTYTTAKTEFYPDLEIIEKNYKSNSNNNSDFEHIPIKIIEPKPIQKEETQSEDSDLLNITVKEFYAKQYTLTDEDLKVLSNHKSKTISNIAQKRLSK